MSYEYDDHESDDEFVQETTRFVKDAYDEDEYDVQDSSDSSASEIGTPDFDEDELARQLEDELLEDQIKDTRGEAEIVDDPRARYESAAMIQNRIESTIDRMFQTAESRFREQLGSAKELINKTFSNYITQDDYNFISNLIEKIPKIEDKNAMGILMAYKIILARNSSKNIEFIFNEIFPTIRNDVENTLKDPNYDVIRYVRLLNRILKTRK